MANLNAETQQQAEPVKEVEPVSSPKPKVQHLQRRLRKLQQQVSSSSSSSDDEQENPLSGDQNSMDDDFADQFDQNFLDFDTVCKDIPKL